MSKENEDKLGLGEGLEDVGTDIQSEATETKKEKIQTAEELAVIVAGIEKIKQFGVSERFAQVMELVPEWNGDKTALSIKKEEVITQKVEEERAKPLPQQNNDVLRDQLRNRHK